MILLTILVRDPSDLWILKEDVANDDGSGSCLLNGDDENFTGLGFTKDEGSLASKLTLTSPPMLILTFSALINGILLSLNTLPPLIMKELGLDNFNFSTFLTLGASRSREDEFSRCGEM